MKVSSAFTYSVIATFDDPSLIEPWTDWLRGHHLADVCRAGATSAQLVVHDVAADQPPRREARYHFADRDAFDTYERDHAPRLREEGLRLFPRGIQYQRTTGEIRLVVS